MTARGRAAKKAARPRDPAPAPESEPNSGSRTALQKHVDFFDTNHDGRITLAETYAGLRRLGVGILRSATFASVIHGALGPATSRALTLTIDTARIHFARHGSDTSVYDRNGRFSPARFQALFRRHDPEGEGALGGPELSRMFSRNRTDLLGHLGSRAEFGLLLELAGEERAGRRVLTRERLGHFYNGSLFYTLAEEVKGREAGPRRTKRPRGAATRAGMPVAP